jgi:hypothetical protein
MMIRSVNPNLQLEQSTTQLSIKVVSKRQKHIAVGFNPRFCDSFDTKSRIGRKQDKPLLSSLPGLKNHLRSVSAG